MISTQTADEIVLLSYLTGMSQVDAAYAVLPDFDHSDILQTMDITACILSAEKRLDREFKKTHS